MQNRRMEVFPVTISAFSDTENGSQKLRIGWYDD